MFRKVLFTLATLSSLLTGHTEASDSEGSDSQPSSPKSTASVVLEPVADRTGNIAVNLAKMMIKDAPERAFAIVLVRGA